MVAPDDDGCADFAVLDHLVEAQTSQVPFLVSEPADTRGKTFEVDFFAGLRDPALQVLVVREKLENRLVGSRDVGRVSGQCNPAERSLAFGEERADVGGDESGEVERAVVTSQFRLAPDRVAVVEHDGPLVLKFDHRLDLFCHCCSRTKGESFRVFCRVAEPVCDRFTFGKIRQWVVSTRLVGHDVNCYASREHLGKNGRGVADEPNRSRNSLFFCIQRTFDGDIDVIGHLVEIPVVDATLQTFGVDIDNENGAVVHGDSERLSATHSTASAREGQRAGERPVELFASDSSERLIRSLQDSLRADVNPGSGSHLAVHRESLGFEFPELGPIRPVTHKVRVGDENAWRPFMGREDSHGLSRLHQECLVGFECV